MIYSLGEGIELNLDTVELTVDGETARIEPQVYDVIVYLATNAERVVTKEELLDNVWGDRFVSESALTSRIKTARRAVNDDGKAQRLIRTVHGRGYRWVGQFVGRDGDQPTAPAAAAPDQDQATSGDPTPTQAARPRTERGQGTDENWPLVGRADELALLAELFHRGDCGGVLLTGSAGAGKSRLADEVVRLADCGGVTVSRIRGYAEVRSIPFACLAHLLPADFSATSGPDGDLSRGLYLQAAVNAIAEPAGDGRLVLLVDDVDRIDDLSLAVVSALGQSGRIFLVATQRTDERTTPALGPLLDTGVIQRVELGPLADDVLGVTLYRTLGAPLEARCLRSLLDASSGSPGLLRQLVENSLHSGTLELHDGVWNLTGDLSPPTDLIELVEGRLADLDRDHREAAELVAIAGSFDFDVAIELIGEEKLDALDLRGMLAIDDDDAAAVRLAHPTFGDVLRTQLRPLRQRRLQKRLADVMTASGTPRQQDRLRIARWRLESGESVDPAALLENARLAVIEKDDETALAMIDRLKAEGPDPLVSQLEAEVAFRRGSPTDVERLLEPVDLDQVDPVVRAQIVRRRTTNLFFGLMDNTRPFEILDAEVARADGEVKTALQSQRLALGAMVGDLTNANDGVEAIVDESQGYIRLELLRTLSYTTWALGNPARALEHVHTANELAASLGPSLSRPGLGLSDMVEVFCSLALGDMARGRAVAERVGVAVAYGWRAIAAARLAVYQGFPTTAVELLENPIGYADARGQGFVAAWMRTALAEAELTRGRLDVAVELLKQAEPLLGDRGRTVDIDMKMMLAPVRAAAGSLDEALESLYEAAERSSELNFVVGVLLALQTASRLGSPERAEAKLDELAPEVDFFQGVCQRDEIRARAADDHVAMIDVASRYEKGGLSVAAARLYDAAGATEDRDRVLAGIEAGVRL